MSHFVNSGLLEERRSLPVVHYSGAKTRAFFVFLQHPDVGHDRLLQGGYDIVDVAHKTLIDLTASSFIPDLVLYMSCPSFGRPFFPLLTMPFRLLHKD